MSCCNRHIWLPQVAEQLFPYRDLEHELLAAIVRLQGVQNGGKLGRIELDCEWDQKLIKEIPPIQC